MSNPATMNPNRRFPSHAFSQSESVDEFIAGDSNNCSFLREIEEEAPKNYESILICNDIDFEDELKKVEENDIDSAFKILSMNFYEPNSPFNIDKSPRKSDLFDLAIDSLGQVESTDLLTDFQRLSDKPQPNQTQAKGNAKYAKGTNLIQYGKEKAKKLPPNLKLTLNNIMTSSKNESTRTTPLSTPKDKKKLELKHVDVVPEELKGWMRPTLSSTPKSRTKFTGNLVSPNNNKIKAFMNAESKISPRQPQQPMQQAKNVDMRFTGLADNESTILTPKMKDKYNNHHDSTKDSTKPTINESQIKPSSNTTLKESKSKKNLNISTTPRSMKEQIFKSLLQKLPNTSKHINIDLSALKKPIMPNSCKNEGRSSLTDRGGYLNFEHIGGLEVVKEYNKKDELNLIPPKQNSGLKKKDNAQITRADASPRADIAEKRTFNKCASHKVLVSRQAETHRGHLESKQKIHQNIRENIQSNIYYLVRKFSIKNFILIFI